MMSKAMPTGQMILKKNNVSYFLTRQDIESKLVTKMSEKKDFWW